MRLVLHFTRGCSCPPIQLACRACPILPKGGFSSLGNQGFDSQPSNRNLQWCLYWTWTASNHWGGPLRWHFYCSGWCASWYHGQWLLGRLGQIIGSRSFWSIFTSRGSGKLNTPKLFWYWWYGKWNHMTLYKRLASCLVANWDHPYSSTSFWLHCRLTFLLFRSAIQCIRGGHSSCGHATKSPPPIDLAIFALQCI